MQLFLYNKLEINLLYFACGKSGLFYFFVEIKIEIDLKFRSIKKKTEKIQQRNSARKLAAKNCSGGKKESLVRAIFFQLEQK